MAAFIKAENLKHRFVRKDEEGNIVGETPALDGIDLTVKAGQFLAVLGQNGSGKSTFARHLNVLLSPTEGTLIVDGKDTAKEELVWEIRRAAGMIFQNPDNQIVAGIVEEDVAFGPENLGVPTQEIQCRVDDSLRAVEMEAYRGHSPEQLSGGQKQRVAVAGVVAMHPRCLILDEATAMLDPAGRQEVMETVHRLNREDGVTVIWITHFMDEAVDADFIYVLDEGKVVMQGTPREIFSEEEALKRHGLTLPQVPRLADALRKSGCSLPLGILTRGELADALCADGKSRRPQGNGTVTAPQQAEAASGKEKIRLSGVSYTYTAGTAYASQALKDVNLTIYEKEIVGLIGHTGSGKSTLIQMCNGLLEPDAGSVYYEGEDICAQRGPGSKGLSRRALRGQVGLVFQFAESQLFETTVLKDVAYGPKNLGLDEEEAQERAAGALRLVKLGEACWEKSPFELSGGQRRRAAIAGVIAMRPSVLILDEPTAGLDPRGKADLLDLIRTLHDDLSLTVIFVSHDMGEVAETAGRIVVLNEGRILLDGTPEQVFSHARELEEVSLAVPEVTNLMRDLHERGWPVRTSVTTLQGAVREITRVC